MDLRLDLGADLDDLELAGEDLRQAAKSLGDVDLLQKRLPVVGLQPERSPDQVGEQTRVVDVGHHDLELVGQVGDVAGDGRERLLNVAHQRGQFRTGDDDVRPLGDLRHEIRVARDPAVEVDSLSALDEHSQGAVGNPDHPRDDADHADVVQILRAGGLELGGSARDHRDRAVTPERLVDQLDAPLLTDVERDQHLRKRDRVPEGQHPDLTRERARAVDGDVAPAGFRDADLDHRCDEDSLRIGTE